MEIKQLWDKYTNRKKELKKQCLDMEKMTLREVMEATRETPIFEGGLEIFMEKMVREIEELKRATSAVSSDPS